MADLLGRQPLTLPLALDLVRGAVDAHLHPELVRVAGRVPGVAVLAELVRITDVTATGSGLTECMLVLRVKIT